MEVFKQKFRGLIISSVVLGFIADALTAFDYGYEIQTVIAQWNGFVIFIPLALLVSLFITKKIFEIIKNTNMGTILIFKLFLPLVFASIMVFIVEFAVWFYDWHTVVNPDYDIAYLFWFFPALITGATYGLVVAFSLKK